MDQQVLHLLQAMQMDFELGIAPPGERPHVAAGEAEVLPLHLQPVALGCDHRVHCQKQTPRLRRQLVERTAQYLVRETVGDGDVVKGYLYIVNRSSAMLDCPLGTLVLME